MFGMPLATYVVIVIISLLVSMTIHEFMHAYAGYLLGDRTASVEGRLSLNPLRHIDPVMTVLLPTITLILPPHAPVLAAKPVPFNPERVKYAEFGAALLALAGPLSNFVLAFIAAFLARFFVPGSLALQVIDIFIGLNVLLFVFNLIPIPPLDGSRILYAFAPDPLRSFMDQIEPVGIIIVFGLVVLGVLGGLLSNIEQLVLNLLP
jgi:Zn-dependent protease